ncbi:hypothetical protein [Pseudoflavonifractor sp. HCP28S3_F10]|nr:hypothetical protein [Pseudoflavonifractor sp.]
MLRTGQTAGNSSFQRAAGWCETAGTLCGITLELLTEAAAVG